MLAYVCFAYSCTVNLVMMQIKTEYVQISKYTCMYLINWKCGQVEFVHVAAVNEFFIQLVQNCCLSLLDGVVS